MAQISYSRGFPEKADPFNSGKFNKVYKYLSGSAQVDFTGSASTSGSGVAGLMLVNTTTLGSVSFDISGSISLSALSAKTLYEFGVQQVSTTDTDVYIFYRNPRV